MEERDDWHLTELIKHDLGRGDPFAAAVRATRMPMVITDPSKPDNPIIFCNEAFQTLTGYTRTEIIGRNCRFLQGPDTDRDAVAKIRHAIEAGENVAIDLLNYRKDGSTFWNALYLSPVRNDGGSIQFFFASQLDISERVEAHALVQRQKRETESEVERRTADLTAALEAKTLLLHEVDHRVKNNLTMIGSLLRLQARTIADPAIGAKLEAMLERVDALAAVHRRLYQSDDVRKFDVGAFAANLASDVLGASGRSDIQANIETEKVEIPANAATALGLVLNEIVTNAVKHAFADGRSGVLKIEVRREADQAVIVISDDGPGLPEQPRKDGLGRVLIERLTRQVGATVCWERLAPGVKITIVLPLKDPA